MRLIIIFASILIFFFGCAGTQMGLQNTLTAELIDYGICTINLKETVKSNTTASGKYNVTQGVKFERTTIEIPAELGISFGIKYVVNGGVKGDSVNLRINAIHPPIKGKTSSSANINAKFGTWRADFYTFNENYELVPGNWVLQIYFKNDLLLEKSFLVFKK